MCSFGFRRTSRPQGRHTPGAPRQVPGAAGSKRASQGSRCRRVQKCFASFQGAAGFRTRPKLSGSFLGASESAIMHSSRRPQAPRTPRTQTPYLSPRGVTLRHPSQRCGSQPFSAQLSAGPCYNSSGPSSPHGSARAGAGSAAAERGAAEAARPPRSYLGASDEALRRIQAWTHLSEDSKAPRQKTIIF